MATSESIELPEGVMVDTFGSPKCVNVDFNSKQSNSKHTKSEGFSFILQFKCKCPDVDEVRKLHPSIKHVFIPKRPASITYCVLHFSSEETCNEVRKALHFKKDHPFQGPLKCRDTTKKVLMNLTGLPPNQLSKTHFSRLELKHMKRMSKDPPEDVPQNVKQNSTANELLIRYGVVCFSISKSGSGSSSKKKGKRAQQVQRALTKKRNKRLKRL